MASGLVGYMGYDTVRLVEKIPDKNPDVLGLPDSLFLRPTVMAIFDSLEGSVTIVTPVWGGQDTSGSKALEDAKERLRLVVDDLKKPLPIQITKSDRKPKISKPKSNMTRKQFFSMVNKAVEYIHAGDAFQVVTSQRFTLPFSHDPFSYYRSLRRLNPSPFLFFLDFPH